MDKLFRVKHEALKTLYTAYVSLYSKYKSKSKSNSNYNQSISKISDARDTSDAKDTSNTLQDDKKHSNVLKTIHTEMKYNNTNLYNERLSILKKIKDSPNIDKDVKDHICGSLLAVFKMPPNTDYKQLPMLDTIKALDKTLGITTNNINTTSKTKQGEDKISISELDDAYLQKHNELMSIYKAYQGLFNTVLNYKDELDKYKQLPTTSNISRIQMNKLIKDQGFVMEMIDKMQNQLADKNIISNSDKVPVNPVASNPENIKTFNNTMRDQIRHIIDKKVEINPNMKVKIEDLLGQFKDCDSNDKFCHDRRKIILLKQKNK